MSIETLVVLALFIVLPLIQRVVRARHQRNQPLSERGEGPSSGRLVPTPPSKLEAPPLPDTAAHSAPEALASSGHTPALHARAPVALVQRPDPTIRRDIAVALRTRPGLRSAIVLLAVLGPCRASNPHDWPGRVGRV
jgi:hypothetical protein